MPAMGDLVLMSKDGNTELYRNYDIFNTSITIQDEIDKFVSAGINVTAVSATVGGPVIDPTSSVMDYVGSGEGLTLYDVTPQADTITGFYLDGNEYKFDTSATSGISTTQPSNPVAGSTYYDTTSGKIKVYNGTSWEDVGGLPSGGTAGQKIEKTASGAGWVDGELVEVSTGPNYLAMKGPCPDGFHIGTKDEWLNIKNILYTIGSIPSYWMDQFSIYLKLPMGYRESGSDRAQGTIRQAYYMTSSVYNDNNAYYIWLYLSQGGGSSNTKGKCIGAYIRPFKNISVIPDSNWTTIYDGSSTATGAGIFHNSTLGLISVSSDGINWITIADKNMGATTVYNSGDTLSESNCGGFFQWGNNYMFPRTGSVTTSSTQVDASNYGPGNYYYSSTWITGTTWDSSNNNNLWGGEEGPTTSAYAGDTELSTKEYVDDLVGDVEILLAAI